MSTSQLGNNTSSASGTTDYSKSDYTVPVLIGAAFVAVVIVGSVFGTAALGISAFAVMATMVVGGLIAGLRGLHSS